MDDLPPVTFVLRESGPASARAGSAGSGPAYRATAYPASVTSDAMTRVAAELLAGTSPLAVCGGRGASRSTWALRLLLLLQKNDIPVVRISGAAKRPADVLNPLAEIGGFTEMPAAMNPVQLLTYLRSARGIDRLVMIFDDADALPAATFRLLDLLTLRAQASWPRLQFVLIGSIELWQSLQAPDLRNFRYTLAANRIVVSRRQSKAAAGAPAAPAAPAPKVIASPASDDLESIGPAGPRIGAVRPIIAAVLIIAMAVAGITALVWRAGVAGRAHDAALSRPFIIADSYKNQLPATDPVWAVAAKPHLAPKPQAPPRQIGSAALATTHASVVEAPPRARGSLVLMAGPDDTMAGLYAKVYSNVTPPPYEIVEAANPAPIRYGTLVVFPVPLGGWAPRSN